MEPLIAPRTLLHYWPGRPLQCRSIRIQHLLRPKQMLAITHRDAGLQVHPLHDLRRRNHRMNRAQLPRPPG